jgi:hypothetical protein
MPLRRSAVLRLRAAQEQGTDRDPAGGDDSAAATHKAWSLLKKPELDHLMAAEAAQPRSLPFHGLRRNFLRLPYFCWISL